MTSMNFRVFRIPADLALRLSHWSSRPSFLGAWLDVALEDHDGVSAGTWTEVELIQRWRKEWSPEKCRFWISKATELGLLSHNEARNDYRMMQMQSLDEHVEPTARASLVVDTADPERVTSTPASESGTYRPDASPSSCLPVPEDLEALAEKIAEMILHSIPALQDLKSLELATASALGGGITFDFTELVPLDAVEKSYVKYVLEKLGGNKAQAAEVLNVDPSTLYRKLNRWGLE